MTKRMEHTFQFKASEIAAAAKAEADYHEDRAAHWQIEYDHNIGTVEATIGAKVTRRAVTMGEKLDVVVDYGDPEAWAQVRRANQKMRQHREEAEQFLADHYLYATQGDRVYDLDTADVHHYRLGGGPRDE
jgi:hypothetical protein